MFNLQFSFLTPGSLSEYIQDQLSSVYDFCLNIVFQVLLLDGAEVIVENDEVGLCLIFKADDFFDFSLSDEVFWTDFLAELERRWGEYYLGTEDIEQALSHTQHAVEVAEEQEARLDWGLSLRILGEIYLRQSKYQKADSNLNNALKILEELGSDYEAAKTVLVLARLALDKGIGFDRARLEYQVCAVVENIHDPLTHAVLIQPDSDFLLSQVLKRGAEIFITPNVHNVSERLLDRFK